VYLEKSDEENIVPDWNATCSEWTNRLPYVINQTYCRDLQHNIVGPFCCDVEGDWTNSDRATSESAESGASLLQSTGQAMFVLLGISLLPAWLY
jgi:hypothetical protein